MFTMPANPVDSSPAELPTSANTVRVPNPPADLGRAARVGLWVLGLGLGGFLLWASLAPLDEGVPSPGIVAMDTKRKAVQHLSGGIVKQVLVREGDLVKEGQTLIQLDDVVAKANYESIRQRYLGLRALQGRLMAEQAGQNAIVIHPDLQEAESDPSVHALVAMQQQLRQARKAALMADLKAMEENGKGQESLLRAYDGMLGNRRTQLALLNEELKNIRELVKDGYATRNRQLELERMVADSSSSIAELQGSMARGRHTMDELRQRMLSRQLDYRKEVETQLTEVMRDVQSDAERYAAVKADLARMDIKSPASGQVVGLAVQTVGGVVLAGQKLMDVVPENEPLLLEAHIDPHLIDRVRVGLITDIRFSAFAHSPQLVVQGQVLSVSRDLLTDQPTGASFYLARVKVLPEGMKILGTRQLQAGMPVEVVIRTGERTLLTYLLSPLSKRMAASMKEE